MLITVSGPAGSGKSTLADALATELSCEHVSGGDIFRSIADERDHLVLESRLAGWMAGEYADLRLWLDGPLDVRTERIADREEKSVEQARKETQARAESEALRYREYYGIDIDDLSIYDLVINTARWDPDGVTDLALQAVETYDEASDEGKTPITGIEYDFGE